MRDEQLNVLVIDDDPHIRRMLVELLVAEEHQAVPADSAEDGLHLLPLWTFQVAFIDQNLPGMEGLVFGEYLRRNNPNMTIALVTAEEDRTLARKSRDLSITFIKKPFMKADILAVIDDYVAAESARHERRLAKEDRCFAPPIASFHDELAACYSIPGVPERIEDRLVGTIKRCLNELRTVSRYTERDRVVALSGLLAASVLGVDLPRAPSGRTLFEEYDELMRQHGRRTEFDEDGDE